MDAVLLELCMFLTMLRWRALPNRVPVPLADNNSKIDLATCMCRCKQRLYLDHMSDMADHRKPRERRAPRDTRRNLFLAVS